MSKAFLLPKKDAVEEKLKQLQQISRGGSAVQVMHFFFFFFDILVAVENIELSCLVFHPTGFNEKLESP